MKAAAEVCAEPDGHGGIRFPALRSQAPLLLRRTPDGVHLVGGAAGPLGGDDLHLLVRVRSGAALLLRSVAASLAQPDPAGRPSDLRIEAHVEDGASLDWAPEPLVATAGAHHRVHIAVHLYGDAALLWRDITVLGRHHETAGLVEQELLLTQDGSELLCQQHAWGEGAPAGWSGPAVLAGARVVATQLAVRWSPLSYASQASPPGKAAGPSVSVLRFAPGCVLTTGLGASVPSVVRLLDEATAATGTLADRRV